MDVNELMQKAGFLPPEKAPQATEQKPAQLTQPKEQPPQTPPAPAPAPAIDVTQIASAVAIAVDKALEKRLAPSAEKDEPTTFAAALRRLSGADSVPAPKSPVPYQSPGGPSPLPGVDRGEPPWKWGAEDVAQLQARGELGTKVKEWRREQSRRSLFPSKDPAPK